MSTLDTHRESKGYPSQEAKPPQAADEHTSTVSTGLPKEITYLDMQLSNPYCVRCTNSGLCPMERCLDVILGFNHGN